MLRYITTTDRDKIGLVIPAWTQNQRKDYQYKGYWFNQRIDPDGDVFSWTRRSLDTYLNFQILCERYNLPYMQVQMLSPYQDWLGGLRPRDTDPILKEDPNWRYTYPGKADVDNKKILDFIDTYEDKINSSKFIGWPLSNEYGGFSLQKRLIYLKDKTMLSTIDHHPNKKGHEVIARFIYERL